MLGRELDVVEALAGTSDPQQILAAGGEPGAAALIDGIAAALAAVHRMPADAALAPPVDDPLALLREPCTTRLGEPHPAFELAFRALGRDARRRPGARSCTATSAWAT